MPGPMKFFLSMTVAGLLLTSPWADAVDRPNNKKVDKDNPVTKCQMGCQNQKTNESYEECMLKCKETDKSKPPMVLEPKK